MCLNIFNESKDNDHITTALTDSNTITCFFFLKNNLKNSKNLLYNLRFSYTSSKSFYKS